MREEITVPNPPGDAKAALSVELTTALTRAPRVALLGWCDRAAKIEGLHQALAHINVQGLSHTRISHIFPFTMRDMTFVVGLYNPRPGEALAVEFRHSDGSKAFDLTMTIAKMEVFEHGLNQYVEPRAVPEPLGWYMVTTQVANDVFVVRPDTLSAFLKTEEGEHFLASFNLLHAPLPLYSPDQVAALRSDPLAS
jgi:hypothetical protein